MRKFLFISIGLFTLFACNDIRKLERAIQTSWVVESLVFEENNEPIPLQLNLFLIEENHECKLPALMGAKRSLANWSLSKSKNGNYIFEIDSSTETIYNGKYTLSFESKPGLNKMVLKSDSLRITCSSLN